LQFLDWEFLLFRFEEIMETVFKWEGGYVDHPQDPGGATNHGITHKVLAKWRGVASVTKQEVRDLTKAEARDIFKSRYYDVIKGGHLPRPIDLVTVRWLGFWRTLVTWLKTVA
jgi:lysozyme family protein